MLEGHRLLLAGAGAGKTTYLVKNMLNTTDYSLITTFTVRNAEEIKNKIREINQGAIPQNIEVMTWDTFLISQGIKPFFGCISNKKIKGLKPVKGQADGAAKWIKSSSLNYYMTSTGLLYSDKLAHLACICDECSRGLVVRRLVGCYQNIFVDEAQDLAGYDFEFLKRLLQQSKTNIVLACDPRQVTYSTHSDRKNKKYNDGHIDRYIQEQCNHLKCQIDQQTLNHSYRCRQEICSFSSRLYEGEYQEVKSKADYADTGHDGVFLVRTNDIEKYLKKYPETVQLRDSCKIKVISENPVMNMGESKETTLARVLIYPTNDMLKWVDDNSIQLKPRTKSKFYVALTRARYSAAIVCKDSKIFSHDIQGLHKWMPE